eukprot:NODE_662_length_4925_cov_0.478243.p3 type:complete len:282 gc:universal NODE_662_length_4925_cov_0.478243:260-1105(+)
MPFCEVHSQATVEQTLGDFEEVNFDQSIDKDKIETAKLDDQKIVKLDKVKFAKDTCLGITKAGVRCRNKEVPYCHLHKDQKNSPETLETCQGVTKAGNRCNNKKTPYCHLHKSQDVNIQFNHDNEKCTAVIDGVKCNKVGSPFCKTHTLSNRIDESPMFDFIEVDSTPKNVPLDTCKGITTKGKRCKRKEVPYCHSHKNQDPNHMKVDSANDTCQGLTKSGARCKNKQFPFCNLHQPKKINKTETSDLASQVAENNKLLLQLSQKLDMISTQLKVMNASKK